MRARRLKVPVDHPAGYYHCLSRVVDRRFYLGELEKEKFTRLMRECERFCRVRVLTFAVMSNHFHILVEVPKRPPVMPGPDEILAEVRRLTGYQFPGVIRHNFELLRNQPTALAAYLETFYVRMYDVSTFMKMLKQRFSQWYNGRTGRKGTLWEERFRSVLVDGEGEALVTMAAYIDLNPVRAGLVKSPEAYRWCGYAEAEAGGKLAQSGIRALARCLNGGKTASRSESMGAYRQYLYLEGDERREGTREDGRPRRGALTALEVAHVLAEKGRLPVHDYLRCRVRYFCDGAIIGSREFVDGIFHAHRKRFGPKRRSGARRMKGLEGPALFALRDLQIRVFGAGDSSPPKPKPTR